MKGPNPIPTPTTPTATQRGGVFIELQRRATHIAYTHTFIGGTYHSQWSIQELITLSQVTMIYFMFLKPMDDGCLLMITCFDKSMSPLLYNHIYNAS